MNVVSNVSHDKGKYRFTMEDDHNRVDSIWEQPLIHQFLKQENISITALPRVSFYGIYDGHGGTFSANYCSKNLLNTIVLQTGFIHTLIFFHQTKDKGLLKDIKAFITEGFKTVDKTLLDCLYKDKRSTDGCTAICSIIVENILITINAGDARSVMVRRNKKYEESLSTKELDDFCIQEQNVEDIQGISVVALSRDHKAGKSYEKKRIEETGGRLVGTAPSRGFGDFLLKKKYHEKKIEGDLVSCVPEITFYRIDTNVDVLLVLACDGVWDKMKNIDIGSFVEKELTQKKVSFDSFSRAIVDEALRRNTKDNVSVIAVTFKDE